MADVSGHDCVPVDSNDPVYVLYTSGTTGSPKVWTTIICETSTVKLYETIKMLKEMNHCSSVFKQD